MLELALALVGLVTAGIIALIGHAITSQAAVLIGLVAIALGLAVGLTTGLWYHVMLHRILSARMRLPGRWTRTGEAYHWVMPPAAGSVKRTVVPCPTSLSIASSPPWASTRCLTMARPSPVPPSSRERALSTR